MNKKAGMELSINAIVILIIAMVVLGIGILFIRGLFAKSAEKLTTAISTQEIKNPATPETPVVADREILISKTNPTKTLVISVYNIDRLIAGNVTVNMSDCVSGESIIEGTGGTPKYYLFRTAPQDIPGNTYVGYQGIVSFNTSQSGLNLKQGDTIVCKLEAKRNRGTGTSLGSTTVSLSVTS